MRGRIVELRIESYQSAWGCTKSALYQVVETETGQTFHLAPAQHARAGVGADVLLEYLRHDTGAGWFARAVV